MWQLTNFDTGENEIFTVTYIDSSQPCMQTTALTFYHVQVARFKKEYKVNTHNLSYHLYLLILFQQQQS